MLGHKSMGRSILRANVVTLRSREGVGCSSGPPNYAARVSMDYYRDRNPLSAISTQLLRGGMSAPR
jgi:hypothetical protein